MKNSDSTATAQHMQLTNRTTDRLGFPTELKGNTHPPPECEISRLQNALKDLIDVWEKHKLMIEGVLIRSTGEGIPQECANSEPTSPVLEHIRDATKTLIELRREIVAVTERIRI